MPVEVKGFTPGSATRFARISGVWLRREGCFYLLSTFSFSAEPDGTEAVRWLRVKTADASDLGAFSVGDVWDQLWVSYGGPSGSGGERSYGPVRVAFCEPSGDVTRPLVVSLTFEVMKGGQGR